MFKVIAPVVLIPLGGLLVVTAALRRRRPLPAALADTGSAREPMQNM